MFFKKKLLQVSSTQFPLNHYHLSVPNTWPPISASCGGAIELTTGALATLHCLVRTCQLPGFSSYIQASFTTWVWKAYLPPSNLRPLKKNNNNNNILYAKPTPPKARCDFHYRVSPTRAQKFWASASSCEEPPLQERLKKRKKFEA